MDTKHISRSRKRRQSGISLIEALIVVVVTAIVATTAAPSLAAFIDGRRLLGGGRSAMKSAASGGIAVVFDDATGAIVSRCTGVAAATATGDLVTTDLSSCTGGAWLLLRGTIRFTSAVPPLPSQASDAPPAVAVALTLSGGTYATAPDCSADAMKTVRYQSSGTLHIEAVAIDALPASLGHASWSDTGDRFVAFRCLVTPRAGGRWSGRSTLVPAGWTIGVGSADRRVCRFAADRDGSGAIDANIEHPANYAGVAGALPGQNFIVVRGDQSCPAHPMPTCSPPPPARCNINPEPSTTPPSLSDTPITEADPGAAFAAPMREALALAQHAVGLSDPNPRVGCVIVAADGHVLGRGHTQEAGGAHAEVMALRDAGSRGADVRGATVVVTLEPCSHHGRTPPCADALIEAGVGRVVMAMRDPNPLVAGQGAARLAAAGIEILDGPFASEAHEINIGFVSRMTRGRPWLRLKVAVSLDGRTALANGASQWITSEAARSDGHAWRRRAGAVLTGVGTVLEDDPRLDVRLVRTAKHPLRIVVDSRLETPPAARIVEPPGPVLLYAAAENGERRRGLEARGVEIALLPSPSGKVDLAAMLVDLGQRGINELHIEAGEKLNASFLRERLVDELLVYIAPRLLGSGRSLAALGPFERLEQGLDFRIVETAALGDDLRLLLRPR